MAQEQSTEAATPHWLDRLIDGVVEHNAGNLSAHQIVNAIMHAPPIVNAIQQALDERGPEAAADPDFAKEIRLAFTRVVETHAPTGGEFLQSEQ